MSLNSRALLRSSRAPISPTPPFPSAHPARSRSATPACAPPHQLHGRARLGALRAPQEFAVGVFDRILEEGPRTASSSAACTPWIGLRIEKAYRHWGHDIGEEDTPLEARPRLRRRLSTRRSPFIGREALLKQKSQKKLTKRLAAIRARGPRSRCSITTSRSIATASSSATPARLTTATHSAAPSPSATSTPRRRRPGRYLDAGRVRARGGVPTLSRARQPAPALRSPERADASLRSINDGSICSLNRAS